MFTKTLELDSDPVAWLKTAPIFGKIQRPIPISAAFPLPLESYLLLESHRADQKMDPQRRKLVANQGTFSFEQMRTLIHILREHSSSETLYCHYDVLAMLSNPVVSKDFGECAFVTNFDEFMDLTMRPHICCSPTNWWGTQNDWFFDNGVDSDYAVFGGSQSIASKIAEAYPWKIKVASADTPRALTTFIDL